MTLLVFGRTLPVLLHLGSRLLVLQSLAGLTRIAELVRRLSTPATISLTWPIRIGQTQTLVVAHLAEFKSTPRPSSVTCVPKNSLVHIIYDHICAHIRTSGHLFVLYVAKRSPDSTIANGMKDFTPVRRSLYVGVNCALSLDSTGDAVVALPAQTHLVGTFDLKRVECVSNHYSMKKQPSAATNK
jgi:hypothetical protein